MHNANPVVIHRYTLSPMADPSIRAAIPVSSGRVVTSGRAASLTTPSLPESRRASRAAVCSAPPEAGHSRARRPTFALDERPAHEVDAASCPSSHPAALVDEQPGERRDRIRLGAGCVDDRHAIVGVRRQLLRRARRGRGDRLRWSARRTGPPRSSLSRRAACSAWRTPARRSRSRRAVCFTCPATPSLPLPPRPTGHFSSLPLPGPLPKPGSRPSDSR